MRKNWNLKKTLLCVLLLAAAAMLCACSGGDTTSSPSKAPTQQPGLTVTDAPQNNSSDTSGDLPEGYDPSSEEDAGGYAGGAYSASGESLYAGATPIPLDPIDMPTSTPRPELSFSYVEITADKLGIKFEAPGNWTVDDSQSGVIVLTDPTALDNVNASLTIKIASVASDYKLADIKTDIKNELASIGQYNYTEWSANAAEARTLMKKDGYYADYRGVLVDGTIVRGRIQMNLLDNNKLITVWLNAPGWYNMSYLKVYTQFRNTVTAL